ncbi:MAG: hypothetical protein Q8R92_01755 [Deltaproteobacteria bacterium]|nr:hypothetical protein [Deltaproteobacteria bacterium]
MNRIVGDRSTGRLRRALRALPLLAAPLLAPRAALACAVCFDLTSRARDAYYGTTILLILLPFGILGGLIYWLVRATRRQSSADGGAPVGGDPRRI